MTFDTGFISIMQAAKVRLSMTGATGRYLLMLRLVAIDTEKPTMLGFVDTQGQKRRKNGGDKLAFCVIRLGCYAQLLIGKD